MTLQPPSGPITAQGKEPAPPPIARLQDERMSW